MDSILQVLTGAVIFMLTVVLILKGIQRKDFSVLGEVLGSAFMVFAITYDVFFGGIRSDIRNTVIHIGVFVFISSIFLTHLVYLVTGRFKLTNNIQLEVITALMHLQDKYEFIVEHTIIGIFVVNELGRFEFVNSRVEELTGYSQEELLLLRIQDLIEEENFVFEDGKKVDLRKKSGERITVILNGKNTMNSHPTITGSITPVGM